MFSLITRTICPLRVQVVAIHHVFVILNGYHVYCALQILSLILLSQHLDGGVHCLIVNVTDVSDERDVAYAFVALRSTLISL